VDALDSPETVPTPERLAYREAEVAAMLGISERLWQRSVARGRAPKPDICLGRIKLWSRDLLVRWIADAGPIDRE
jgi:hypothetical protein